MTCPHFRRWVVLLLGLLLHDLSAIAADRIPQLAELPDGLSASVRADLEQRRSVLAREFEAFLAEARQFNARAQAERTQAERDTLQTRRARFIDAARAFNQSVADASTVDLIHLDPDRPIIIDPNIVKGRPRAIPVQVSLETLTNANYNKAFDCLRDSDPYTAVKYFEAAAKERPGDLMVRNGWLLANDLVKVRETKAREATAQKAADIAALKGEAYRALMQEDVFGALHASIRARNLDPTDPRLQSLAAAAEHLRAATGPTASPEQRAAAKVVAHAMAAFETRRYLAAQDLLEVAAGLSPQDALVARLLPVAQKHAPSDIRLLHPGGLAKPGAEPADPVISLLFPDPAVPLLEDWVKVFLFPGSKP